MDRKDDLRRALAAGFHLEAIYKNYDSTRDEPRGTLSSLESGASLPYDEVPLSTMRTKFGSAIDKKWSFCPSSRSPLADDQTLGYYIKLVPATIEDLVAVLKAESEAIVAPQPGLENPDAKSAVALKVTSTPMKEVEVNLINEAVRENKNPSKVYREKVPSSRDNLKAGLKGFLRPKKGYAGLALINFDHFGGDACTAYNAGHLAALEHAASGKSPQHLETAYAMNAFADHFLEDSFASGHIRTPRQKLHGTVRVDMDACAMCMHEEDNALDLNVRNSTGEEWRAHGDQKLLDDVNRTNLKHCHDSLMASTLEVYEAWSSGRAPGPDSFKAWSHAPIIASAFSDKNHAPLFNAEGYPRKDIYDPWNRSSKGYWESTYPGTWVSLKESSKFQGSIA